MKRYIALLILSLFVVKSVVAQQQQPHLSVSVGALEGREVVMDSYEAKWLRQRGSTSLALEVGHTWLPSDSDAYAAAYHFPTLSAGLRWVNSRVTMRREADPAWGMAEMVDYDSRLGNTLSAYGTFHRPILRSPRWMLDYALSFGVGYAPRRYHPLRNVDDELIGSHWNIYFGAGLHLSYRVAERWAVRAGLDYFHHSNGALYRPNKGCNTLGPSVALCYVPAYQPTPQSAPTATDSLPRRWQWLVGMEVGMKTLNSDWQRTQFSTPPSVPDYRTSRFAHHYVVEAHVALVRRWALRWSTGAGLEMGYLGYRAPQQHSPWWAGVAIHHAAHFHRLVAATALGIYLYRDPQLRVAELETSYYEKVGLRYALGRKQSLRIGFDIRAHRTKADCTLAVVEWLL